MKLNRSIMITILTVVLAICTGILLSGCASIGDGKDAGPKQESSRRIDDRGTALKETSGSSPEVQKVPVVDTGVSGEKPRVQAANLNTDKDMFKHYATYLKRGLERILPGTLPEINWNGIVAALAGILVISIIYGLAFVLGRLPVHRRGAGRPGGGRQTGEHARGSVSQ